MARLLTALLAIAVTVCFVPQTGAPVYAASTDPAMNLGTEVLNQNVNTSSPETLWYADETWHVIGYDGGEDGAASVSGAVTLLSVENLDQTQYDDSGNYSNVYANSTLRKKIEGADGATGIIDRFSESEQGAIKTRTLVHGSYNEDEPWNTDCIAGDADLTNVALWPLSTKEANAVNESLRIVDPEHTGWATSCWWLRSPGDGVSFTAIVDGIGRVLDFGFVVDITFGVRPAFYLNLESVLFTSAAEGGKSSGAEGADALKAQSDLTNSGSEWKVTVKDNAHAGFTISKTTPIENGVSVEYTGAATGTNEYISAIITDESGAIKYYGRIATVSAAADTVTINTADKLGENDHLYVFNEQYNGDKKTDYASELTEVTIPELISYTVTFKVKNGSWNDGTSTEKKVTLSRCDNEDKALVLQPDDIPAVGNKPANGYKAGSWDTTPNTETAISKDTTYTYTYAKKDDPTPTPTPTKVSGTLLAKITAKGSNSLVLTWNKIDGAEGYDIFFIKCGKQAPKKVKTIKGNKTFKWTKKGLKKKTAYKAVVKAYVMKDGKKTYVRTSPMVHAYTSGGTKNYTNSKSVTVKKTSVSLKAGKTYKIKATVNKLQKGKKLMPTSHAPKLRYVSSNKKIATVSKSGKITAKSKGSCKIYVIAVNGARKAITVTVK